MAPELMFNEDMDTAFLINAEHLSTDAAMATARKLCAAEFGPLRSICHPDKPTAELRLMREPREGDWGYGDAVLWPCAEGEEDLAIERVWVIDDVEVDVHG